MTVYKLHTYHMTVYFLNVTCTVKFPFKTFCFKVWYHGPDNTLQYTPKQDKPPNKGQAKSSLVYTLYRKSPLKEDNLSTEDKTAGPEVSLLRGSTVLCILFSFHFSFYSRKLNDDDGYTENLCSYLSHVFPSAQSDLLLEVKEGAWSHHPPSTHQHSHVTTPSNNITNLYGGGLEGATSSIGRNYLGTR